MVEKYTDGERARRLTWIPKTGEYRVEKIPDVADDEDCPRCDGTGAMEGVFTGTIPCPDCRDADPRAALAYEYPP